MRPLQDPGRGEAGRLPRIPSQNIAFGVARAGRWKFASTSSASRRASGAGTREIKFEDRLQALVHPRSQFNIACQKAQCLNVTDIKERGLGWAGEGGDTLEHVQGTSSRNKKRSRLTWSSPQNNGPSTILLRSKYKAR